MTGDDKLKVKILSSKPISPKDRIANAALSLFIRYGFEGASIAQIVKASAVSKGAFYHYYVSKAQIHGEVVEAYFLAPFAELNLKKLAKQSPKKAKNTLRNYFTQQITNGQDNLPQSPLRLRAFLFDSFIHLPGFDKKFAKNYKQIIKALSLSLAGSTTANKKTKQQAKKILVQIEGELLLNSILALNNSSTDSKNT